MPNSNPAESIQSQHLVKMIFLLTFTVLTLFASLIWIWKLGKQTVGKLPPGPHKFPIIGNFHQIATTSSLPWITYDKLSKKYGSIMSIQNGMSDTIVLSEYEDIKQISSREEMTGRPCEGAILDRNMGKNLGVYYSNGHIWKIMRKFTIRRLRDLGFGTSSMEVAIQKEVKEFINWLKDLQTSNDGIIHVNGLFKVPFHNIIWSLVADVRYSYNDPKILNLIHLRAEFKNDINSALNATVAFPFLRILFPEVSGRSLQLKTVHSIHDLFRDTLKERRQKCGRGIAPTNFVDKFINKIDRSAAKPHPVFTDDQLIITLLDIFQAGSDNTSNIMSFAIQYLMTHPDVQEKLHDEIDRVVPRGTCPTLTHKSSMIYTQATILEIIRCGNVGPILPPRKATRDFYYKGYLFKKGVHVLGNLHSVFSSESFWGDPEIFRPERFLSNNGKLDTTYSERILAFGHGPRVCPGEAVAQASLFLFLTSIVQQFIFRRPLGEAENNIICSNHVIGTDVSPWPFYCLVERRK